MKKFLLTLMFMLPMYSVSAAPNKPTYLEEMDALGSIAGQGLACRAKKYHQYEMLARAIMVGKAPSDKLQQEGVMRYNEAKVNAFMIIKRENLSECDVILSDFDQQKIFKSVLYADGRVKLYDGTLIQPRRTYDASKLYEKDPEVFEKADMAYKKVVAEAKKNSKNAKKLEFRDANYDRYANQF